MLAHPCSRGTAARPVTDECASPIAPVSPRSQLIAGTPPGPASSAEERAQPQSHPEAPFLNRETRRIAMRRYRRDRRLPIPGSDPASSVVLCAREDVPAAVDIWFAVPRPTARLGKALTITSTKVAACGIAADPSFSPPWRTNCKGTDSDAVAYHWKPSSNARSIYAIHSTVRQPQFATLCRP